MNAPTPRRAALAAHVGAGSGELPAPDLAKIVDGKQTAPEKEENLAESSDAHPQWKGVRKTLSAPFEFPAPQPATNETGPAAATGSTGGETGPTGGETGGKLTFAEHWRVGCAERGGGERERGEGRRARASARALYVRERGSVRQGSYACPPPLHMLLLCAHSSPSYTHVLLLCSLAIVHSPSPSPPHSPFPQSTINHQPSSPMPLLPTHNDDNTNTHPSHSHGCECGGGAQACP